MGRVGGDVFPGIRDDLGKIVGGQMLGEKKKKSAAVSLFVASFLYLVIDTRFQFACFCFPDILILAADAVILGWLDQACCIRCIGS